MTKYCLQQTIKIELKKLMIALSKIHTRMYDYFTNESKHMLNV